MYQNKPGISVLCVCLQTYTEQEHYAPVPGIIQGDIEFCTGSNEDSE